ncbi:MAG: hypothetical protein Q7T53_09990 [Deltaproteobacteria bacterium]|nr:hypothetical protein [Deltaproteobacteria bacterium]
MDFFATLITTINHIKKTGYCIRDDVVVTAYELNGFQVWEQNGEIGLLAFDKLNVSPRGSGIFFHAGKPKHLKKVFNVLFPNIEIPR